MKKVLTILFAIYSSVLFAQTNITGTTTTDRNSMTVTGSYMGIVGTTTGAYGTKGVVGLIAPTILTLTGSGFTTVTGTYPNFNINSSSNTYSAGGNISINGTNQIINTSPDQTVILTGSGSVGVTGTYPSFSVTGSYTSITGVNNVISGTYPNITITGNAQTSQTSLTGVNITVSGIYPNITLTGNSSSGGGGSGTVSTITGKGIAVVTTITNGYQVSVDGTAFVTSLVGLNGIKVTGSNVVTVSGGYQYMDVSTAQISYGDSYTAGYLLPTPSTDNYAYRVSTALGKSFTNSGVSATGLVQQLASTYFTRYNQSVSTENQTTRVFNTYQAGLNDFTLSRNCALTLSTLGSYFDAYLTHQFIDNLVLAQDITRSADWTTITGVANYVSKSGVQSGQVKAPIRSVSATGVASIANFKVNNGLVIGYMGGSPTSLLGILNVSVDGVLIGSINQNNQADGNTVVGVSMSGFTITNNNIVAKSSVFWNVTPGYHTIAVSPATTGTAATLDYIGTLADPVRCKPVIISDILLLTASGYTNSYSLTGCNSATVTAANLISDNVISAYSSRGYPVAKVRVNDYINLATDMQSDLIHPNLAGAIKYATAFKDTYNTLTANLNISSPRGGINTIPLYTSNTTLGVSSIQQTYSGGRILIGTNSDDGSSSLQIGTVNSVSGKIFAVKDNSNNTVFDIDGSGNTRLNANLAKLTIGNNASFYLQSNAGLQLFSANETNITNNSVQFFRVNDLGVRIGSGSSVFAPNANSILAAIPFEVRSSTAGWLPPRIKESAINTASTLVFNIQYDARCCYASLPTVTILGGGGTGATATAFFTTSSTVGVVLANNGTGYTSNPVVSIVGGGYVGTLPSTAFATRQPEGYSVYNTTSKTSDFFNGSQWKRIAGECYLSISGVNYTASGYDFGCTLGCNSVARNIGLPSPTPTTLITIPSGIVINIKDEAGTAGASNITITPPSGYLIDGASSYVINTNYGSVGIYFNGVNYFIREKY